MDKRGFKGIWIPREIWLHEGLTMQEKIMLVEIDSLDNENGCFAQNKHFADFLGIGERRVQTIIKSLKAKGYLEISFTYKPGTREIERRVMRIASPPYPRFSTQGGEQNDTTPHEQNDTTPHEQNDVGVVNKTTPGGEGKCADSNTLPSNTYPSNTSGEKKKKAPAKADADAPDFSNTNFSTEMVEAVETWLRYKAERREKYKPTGLKSLISEIQHNVDRYGEAAVISLITTCMASNWRGIIFDKLRGMPEVRRPAAGGQGGQSGQGTMPETNNEFARLRQRLEGSRHD